MVSHEPAGLEWVAYWNPTCEWINRTEQRTASIAGLREPPAKGAIVRGIRAADISLQLS